MVKTRWTPTTFIGGLSWIAYVREYWRVCPLSLKEHIIWTLWFGTAFLLLFTEASQKMESEQTRTLPNNTEQYRTLPNTTKHNWTIPNTTEHYRTTPNTTEHYRTQLNNTEHSRTLPNRAEWCSLSLTALAKPKRTLRSLLLVHFGVTMSLV